MSLSPDDAKSQLIEQVAAVAARRLAGDQAPEFADFVRRYFAGVAPEDLLEREVLDLYGAAQAHWNLGASCGVDGVAVRVYNPQFDRDGWQTTHTVVEIVATDIPFLVDSTRMELNRHGLAVHLLIHPVIDGIASIHAEVDRVSERQLLDGIRADVSAGIG